jgi:AraC family transcriptional regulator
MHAHVDIARFINADISIAHCMFPAWEAYDFISISNPSSIAVSFTEQRKATVQLAAGRWTDRNIPAGSFGTAGVAPIAWIRVREPSECLEVTASPALRAAMAEELRVAHHSELDDLHGSSDPVVWSVSARLRSLLRAPSRNDTLEFETLVLQLYRRLLTARFGGRSPSRGDGALSPTRLRWLVEWIEAHLDRDISIVRLAAVVSLSHAHFIRSFARTMGMPPHQYVRARRMQRARELLARGASVPAAAHAVGFASVSQFRSAFRQTFGHIPHLTPQRGAREWIHKGAK